VVAFATGGIAGDAIEFAADQTHSYENSGRAPCVAYNVIVYG
jgi:hypothetical protein